MKPENIETEATLGLHRLRRQVGLEHEHPTAMIMHHACVELDKGEYGERAVEAMLDLWKELKLEHATGNAISEFSAVVARMYQKSKQEHS